MHTRIGQRIALLMVGGTVLAATLGVTSTAPAASTMGRTPDVGILPFAGDVFTIGSNGSLIAVDPSRTALTAPLFNAAGSPLNLTWGQFEGASATSLAKTVTDLGSTATDIEITLTGLIPGGTYSLFYVTISPNSVNPVCPADPNVALSARFPARQFPDASSFVADSTGAARFHARVPGALLTAANVIIDVIYHFDGHTYGAVPNAGESRPGCLSSFGIDAMRQTLIVQK